MTAVYETNALAYGTRGNTSQNNTTNANNVLGKNDFLKLFVAQLSNQDPMSPLDNSDMLAQFAQFSMVEQITNMSESLDSLKETLTELYGQSIFTQGAALIGKEVVGINEEGNMINGEVSGVKWGEKDLMLKVGNSWLNITKVSEVNKSIE
ncbi:MAG: flagellar hook assembly protein FlgD [Bacillota bacterium]|jgi:flagellar basal-body rod modification protein FlgD